MEILAIVIICLGYSLTYLFGYFDLIKLDNPRERQSDFPPMSKRVFNMLNDPIKSKILIQKIKEAKENEKNRISNKR